jgi:hypothetical protein
MKKRFQKLAVATAVTAAMAGLSLPAQAIVTGIAGEALLVPLTIWDDDRPDPGFDLNTLIEIEVPASVGWEGVANIWMAPHTTPINPLVDPDKYDPAAFVSVEEVGSKVAFLHWFVFNKYSEHLKNDVIKVTPNDVEQINFRDLMGGDLEGVPTYMVIVNDASFKAPENGAKFAMFGDAWLVNGPTGTMQVQIPVLPMSDGPDTTDRPVYADHVVYPEGLPVASPLASGNLMNYADGIFQGRSVFDVPLSTPSDLTYHVLWRDMNVPGVDDDGVAIVVDILLDGILNPRATSQVDLMVFDSEEKGCSDTIYLETELEIICWDPTKTSSNSDCGWNDGLLPSTEEKLSTCKVDENDADGFVSYRFPELIDGGSRSPETSGVMFAIMNRTIGTDDDNDIVTEMALGRYRGWYRQAY